MTDDPLKQTPWVELDRDNRLHKVKPGQGMRHVVIRYRGLAGHAHDPLSFATDGEYLEEFDPEAHDGMGEAGFTSDPSKAMKFESVRDAMKFTMKQPRRRPLRADGEPNRPLRVFHLELEWREE